MQMRPPSWPHTAYCSPGESFCRARTQCGGRAAPPFSHMRRGISPMAEISRYPASLGSSVAPLQKNCAQRKQMKAPCPPGRVAMHPDVCHPFLGAQHESKALSAGITQLVIRHQGFPRG